MRPDRPRLRLRSEAGSSPESAFAPTRRTASAKVAGILFTDSLGNAPSHRILLSVAVTVLLTGIGLSCVLANVLGGHPIVFTVP